MLEKKDGQKVVFIKRRFVPHPERFSLLQEHVVTENERVGAAVNALRQGNIEAFGQLLNQSHVSLRDDYEVSCSELDDMVEAARKVKGVYGSRMTGAGFGGCTVSLVAEEAVEEFRRRVAAEYEAATGLVPRIYVCSAEDGVEAVKGLAT